MAENSKIEWTDNTFNPWWGCVKVSPACDHCYAETFAKRVGFGPQSALSNDYAADYVASKFPIWGKDANRRFFGDKHWSEPLKWNRDAEKAGERRRVFCASMADVMEDREDLKPWRERLYEMIEATPRLDWLLLTKRPQNFKRFLPKSWLDNPRPNVWGMTTVESQEYIWRARYLLETPFAVTGLSIEPMLGPINLTAVPLPETPDITRNLLTGKFHNVPFTNANGGGSMDIETKPRINWVIVGGESGSGARPMHPDWARSLRDQCQAAGVAFHFKQFGEWKPREVGDSDGQPRIRLTDMGENGQNLSSEGGNHVWMQRVGKHAAGRSLDGRTWDELPHDQSSLR